VSKAPFATYTRESAVRATELNPFEPSLAYTFGVATVVPTTAPTDASAPDELWPPITQTDAPTTWIDRDDSVDTVL
jgi:hypothetical protein